jgi:hypothetical protein
MTTTPPTPTPPTGESPGAGRAHSGLTAPASAAAAPAPGAPRLPSLRVTAMLAAGMLALGVAVGAAIGPAPSSSLASSSLPALLGSLARIAATRAVQSSTAAVQPPPITPTATPARKKKRSRGSRAGRSASTQATPSTTTTTSTPEATTPTSKTPTSTGKAKPTTLPPIAKVWLIELTGATFSEAIAQPSAAPYIDSQAIPAGTLLSGWSGLDGGAFASETALLATSGPQLIDTIVQPPCPEGAAGASCAAETPGALTAADEFLKATVPAITSTAAFRESGLIVVTFASVGSATATGLPAGASTATLTAQPPAGVLVISPFASVGARSSKAFNPTSPKQSLFRLLH